MTIRLAVALLLAIAIGCSARPACAEFTLDNLFSDGAVLQRDAKLPVWGTSDQPEKVTVRFAGQEASAEVVKGRWQVELAPLAVNRQPATLSVTQGETTLERQNILVGDVWICAGQSNMRWMVNQSQGGGTAIATAGNDQLRLFTVNRVGVKVPTDDPDHWLLTSPRSVRSFSAVGYFFGRELQKVLGVPLGLINSNVGGTPAERWTSKEALAGHDELKALNTRQSSDLWNAMIAPLTKFPIRGVLWYQGEANAPRAWQYRTLLPVMIQDWRKAWGQGDFPFLIVQLAGVQNNQPLPKEPGESNWAELREAQSLTSQTLPNVGLTVITDLSDGDLHPRNKRDVGERLTLAARALAYGEKIEFLGPSYDKQTIDGDKIIIHFTHVGGGLVADAQELTGFAIAGEDQKFVNAEGRIEGDTVVVRSDQVARPVAVRFGWANYPIVNLWNRAGLPACPFRTDDFPAQTNDQK